MVMNETPPPALSPGGGGTERLPSPLRNSAGSYAVDGMALGAPGGAGSAAVPAAVSAAALPAGGCGMAMLRQHGGLAPAALSLVVPARGGGSGSGGLQAGTPSSVAMQVPSSPLRTPVPDAVLAAEVASGGVVIPAKPVVAATAPVPVLVVPTVALPHASADVAGAANGVPAVPTANGGFTSAFPLATAAMAVVAGHGGSRRGPPPPPLASPPPQVLPVPHAPAAAASGVLP
ncbi:unnamed protein product, partial [Phaeothamnion confervicola]